MKKFRYNWLDCGLCRYGAVYVISAILLLSPVVFATTLDDILDGLETRYSGPGFSAKFFQISTLKAMQIKETASGRLFVKRPGKMRWEYDSPERQVIITDGKKLWIYRPDDNQVMIGKAPAFFGDGKGAGFLSNIRQIRQNFELSLQAESQESNFILQLIPKEKTYDISTVYLSIVPQTFDVVQVITLNEYDDETQIDLHDITYNQNQPDSLFTLQIPKDADVVQIDE
jgi:outer membrane lipoprotein carrier protein